MFLIETLRRNGMKGTEAHRIITTAWPDENITVRHVQRLMKEFSDNKRTSFDRAGGSGRRKSELRENSITLIEEIINENSSLSVKDIADMLDLSFSMAHRILKEDLGKSWFHTRWVPHTLTESNKLTRVERCIKMLETFNSRITKANLITIDEKWFYCRKLRPRNVIGAWLGPDGDINIPQTTRRSNMETKFMAIVAVSLKGHHFFKVLKKNESIDSNSYINFLREMGSHLRHQSNPICFENMALIQDNARPHVSKATTEFLNSKGVKLIKQPPYSPDCNLCDRFVFPRLESLRKRGDFTGKEDLETFLAQAMPSFTQQKMEKAFNKMVSDFELIIQCHGIYI